MSAESNGLQAAIEALIAEHGGTLKDWTVMHTDRDPFRLDIPINHVLGRWVRRRGTGSRSEPPPPSTFAACLAFLDQPGPDFPLGMALSKGKVMPPDPNNPEAPPRGNLGEVPQHQHTLRVAAVGVKYARWLRYVPFEWVSDERNADPVIRIWEPPQPKGYAATDFNFYLPDSDDLTPKAKLDDFRGKQPYHLAIFVKKTSLRDVLGPICREIRGGSVSGQGRPDRHAGARLR